MGRKSRASNRDRSLKDDLTDFENETLAPVRPHPPAVLRPPVTTKLSFGDRRKWAPGSPASAPRDAARDTLGRPARVIHGKVSPKPRQPAGGNAMRAKIPQTWHPKIREVPAFADPRNSNVCLRRKTRRQVLFARKQTRKGAGSAKRYNQWSNVQC